MLITILQIIVALALIGLILLQERSSGLAGIFGGETGGVYQTRRGLERSIFAGTIVLAAVFAALSIGKLLF